MFDLTLPQDRAREVYCAWTARVMRGEWADAALLAFDGDEVVAFISMLALPDVSEYSRQRVFGRGLGATLPDYRGLFTAIQREMIATSRITSYNVCYTKLLRRKPTRSRQASSRSTMRGSRLG